MASLQSAEQLLCLLGNFLHNPTTESLHCYYGLVQTYIIITLGMLNQMMASVSCEACHHGY